MEGKYILGIASVLSLAGIEIAAIYNGIDGILMSGVVGTIAAICGAIAGVTITTKKE